MDILHNSDDNEKQCTKCSCIFPATTEYFYPNKRSKDGLQPICRECDKAKARAYRETNREQVNEKQKIAHRVRKGKIPEPHKELSSKKQYKGCQEWFDRTEEFFHRSKTLKDGLCNYCKECNKVRVKTYQDKYREQVSARRKEYRSKNCEKIAQKRKQCNACLKWFDNTQEFWYRNPKCRNGLLSICKACNREKAKEYRKNNRERVIERQKKYEQVHKEEIRKYRKKYHQANKDKRVEYARQWRKNNKEIGLQWRKNNRERIGKRRKQYLKEHKEHISRQHKLYYAANREHIIEVSKQWNRDNYERLSVLRRQYSQTPAGILAKRANAHNRRALKKKAGGKHTAAQLRELYSKQEGKCFYCKVELGFSRNSWHADHKVPLSRGGSNDISNIVISCPKCNLGKSDKLIDEWMGGREDEGENEQKQTS